MELGQKLGEGAGSEVYAWGDAEALKLFFAGTSREVVEYEARVTSMAHAAGAPAPDARGIVDVDGRYGIIFPRYDGEPLLNLAARGEVPPDEVGGIMAALQHELHARAFDVPIRTFREWVLSVIPSLRKLETPADVIEIVDRTLFDLPPSGVLCHGDLHPGNILMTDNGPVIIDWISAMNANPFVDVAREHVTLSMILVAASWSDQFRAAHQSFIARYASLSDMTPRSLLDAIRPYVTVMAAMRMVESNSNDAERDALISHIRATRA